MQVPLELSFRDVSRTDDIDALIDERIAKLERICDHITSCNMIVERPNKHLDSGSGYRVRIEMHVPPNHDVIARREPQQGDIHDSVLTVIRDTFDAAESQLQKITGLQQEKQAAKRGGPETTAIVDKIFPERGYGFLRTLEEDEIYFHANSLVNTSIENVEIGQGVRFEHEMGNEGLQATSVIVIERPGAGIQRRENP